jgi:nucleoside-diphosphate-sugar epimerase
MVDRVLVTGVSGYLGGHVALQLLEQGYLVRGSVRDLKKADKVRAALSRNGGNASRLELVALDLIDDADWQEAMAGVRYLQHVASPFVTTMPADKMDLVRPAVEGTTRALEAAFTADIERVVLTSSMAAIMYGHDKSRTAPFTADDWTNLDGRGVNAYVESKARAERTAWDIASRHGRTNDLAVINPGGIFGPLLDDDPGTSVALVTRLLDGSVPAAPDISFIVVDVRDVAALHLRAMTEPSAGGHRFPTGAGTYSILEFANILRRALPERAGKLPRFGLPDWIVRIYAMFDADMRGNMGELGVVKRTDALDAKALLGRPFIAAETSIVDTARSVIAHGLV